MVTNSTTSTTAIATTITTTPVDTAAIGIKCGARQHQLHPEPGTSIAAGLVSLVLDWLMTSPRGRAQLDRWRSRHPRRHEKQQGPSWAERHLNRANARVAFVVGAGINLPGPFYLLALGDMATGDYSTAEQLNLIVLFNAIMFLLVEVPLIGYLVRPEETAERVASFATGSTPTGYESGAGWSAQSASP